MDNIYKVVTTLKPRINNCSDNNYRYVIVFVDMKINRYFFELSNTYSDYGYHSKPFGITPDMIIIAYRKSGKIIECIGNYYE